METVPRPQTAKSDQFLKKMRFQTPWGGENLYLWTAFPDEDFIYVMASYAWASRRLHHSDESPKEAAELPQRIRYSIWGSPVPFHLLALANVRMASPAVSSNSALQLCYSTRVDEFQHDHV